MPIATEEISWRSGDIVESPTWFGPTDAPLFGWLVQPADGRATGAVLLCPPVAEEARTSRRTFRVLSQRLAERGLLVLRFDYHGLGDSSGALDDTTKTERWVDDVRCAAGYLRACGPTRLAVVGMRMGATIAAQTVTSTPCTVDDLVLWDPCASGRTFLREQALLHRTMRDVPRAEHDASVETPGYVFNDDVAAAFGSLRLPAPDALDATGAGVVVLTRDDRATPAAVARLAECPGVDMREVSGQRELLDVPPLDAQVPSAAVDLVVETLALRAVDARVDVSTTLRQDVVIGPGIRERVIAVSDDRLFGIATEPVTAPKGPAAVYFNVAIESHIGPARLWVTLARRWAADLGMTGLRFDFGGVGDSPDLPTGERDFVYAPRWIDEADAAVAGARGASGRAVGIGVCSGAYAALESALRNDRVDAIAINPLIDTIEGTLMKHRPGTRDTRRRALREIPEPFHGFAVAHHRIAATVWRGLQWVVPRLAASSVIANAVRHGAHVTLGLAHEDAHAFDVNRYWGFRAAAWRRQGSYSRIDVPGLDHPVLVAQGREALADALTAGLAERLGTSRGAADDAVAVSIE